MTTIAVFNQKGGVGKTTTALNLLAGIALRGSRPLGIDLDAQAHLSHVFGVQPRLAEDTVYSFFVRQRPLGESGVWFLPAERLSELIIELHSAPPPSLHVIEQPNDASGS